MSEKLSRKERAKLQSEQHKSGQASETAAPRAKRVTPPAPRLKDSSLIRQLNIILIILAAGVYLNSLGNQYALDDYGLILENNDTKNASVWRIMTTSYRAGTLSGDNTLYRPLSKAMFNMEWKAFGEAPGISHFINVALFVLSIVLLFRMLRRYMGDKHVIVPFLATALFAVHPIHTEVVANIKGRDDILCFLFFVVTALYVHRFVLTSKVKYLVFSAISFFLCMLSKESAITFVAAIPLMLYFFTPTDRITTARTSLTLAGVAALFLLIRAGVLHGSGFSPVPVIDNYIAGIDGFMNQRATAVAIAGIYLLKLFVPYELVCDASVPQMPPYGLGSWEFLLSFAVFLAAAVFAIMKFRSKHIVSFAILYFFITFSVVSNIPFILGTNYGERLLYTPSLAICLIVAWAVHKLFFTEENLSGALGDFFSSQTKSIAVIGIIVLVYSGITVMRNPVWSDNETLYGTDMQISENSCKLRYFYANHMTQLDTLALLKKTDPAEWAHRVDTGIVEFRNAIALYPGYGDAIQKLAEMFYSKKISDSAEFYYKKAIALSPGNATYRSNFGRVLFEQGRLFEAEHHFTMAIYLNPNYATARNNLAGCYGTSAAQLVNKATLYPQLAVEFNQKATALFQKSLEMSLSAINSDPTFIPAYETTAVTYSNLGDQVNAQKYQAQAQTLTNNGTGHR